jgi:hypothetical protein
MTSLAVGIVGLSFLLYHKFSTSLREPFSPDDVYDTICPMGIVPIPAKGGLRLEFLLIGKTGND